MAKSECENIVKLIPLYIDSMLSEEETDTVCKHIQHCEDCKREYEFLKSIVCTAKEVPDIEVPEDFHKNLMKEIRKVPLPAKRVNLLYLRRSILGVAASAAIIAISVTAHININSNNASQNYKELISSATPAPVEDIEAAPEQKKAKTENPQSEKTLKQETKVETDSEKIIGIENSQPEEIDKGSEATIVMPVNEDGCGAAVACLEEFSVITVTVGEGEREKAEEILSKFEKDSVGYKVCEKLPEVIKKLSALDGFTEKTETGTDIGCDYIVLN